MVALLLGLLIVGMIVSSSIVVAMLIVASRFNDLESETTAMNEQEPIFDNSPSSRPAPAKTEKLRASST